MPRYSHIGLQLEFQFLENAVQFLNGKSHSTISVLVSVVNYQQCAFFLFLEFLNSATQIKYANDSSESPVTPAVEVALENTDHMQVVN